MRAAAGKPRIQGLVSVIMPFLDTPERFFREAVTSLRAQLYEHWELLLIDDGSKTPASAIAKQLAKDNIDKIHYLEHEAHQHLGSSASRNLGLSVARGEYIAFLDSDDVWSPDKLAEQIELLSRSPTAGMLYGNTCRWYGWTGNAADAKRDQPLRLGLRTPQIVEPPALLALSLQGRIAVPGFGSIVVRHDVLEAGRWFEDEFTGMYDDQILYAKLWTSTPVMVVDRCWYKYRQHPGSMTWGSEGLPIHEESRLAYLRWLYAYLGERELQDTPVWKALNRELWLHQSMLPAPLIRKVRRMFWKALNVVRGV